MIKYLKNKKIGVAVLILIILIGVVYFNRNYIISELIFTFQETEESPGVKAEEVDYDIVEDNLEVPWEIVFLPDETKLVTKRPGNLIKIKEGEMEKVKQLKEVEHAFMQEKGLLGMALHPDFEETKRLYLYFTTEEEEGLVNRVESFIYEEDNLTNREKVITDIPGAWYHDGGRIDFGPEGKLYITTGDAGEPDLAQDKKSLAGKILRLKEDGSIPEDNPFENPVYSYGHRNPQGLAWDEEGRFWSSEHGDVARDELNLIQKGENYGWPEIEGMEDKEGMRTPEVFSGTDYTWAPSGAEYYSESIYFTGLRGEALYEADISNYPQAQPEVTAHFKGDFGRLRTVKMGPDGYFYILTNNTDGRGEPSENDDKIIKFNPEDLN